LAGCSTAAAFQGDALSTTGTTSPQSPNASGPSLSATAEDGWADSDVSYEEQFTKTDGSFTLVLKQKKDRINGVVIE